MLPAVLSGVQLFGGASYVDWNVLWGATVPSMSRFASSFCLSLRVKLPFPVEDEDCIVLGLRRRNGRRWGWQRHVTRVSHQPRELKRQTQRETGQVLISKFDSSFNGCITTNSWKTTFSSGKLNPKFIIQHLIFVSSSDDKRNPQSTLSQSIFDRVIGKARRRDL